MASKFNSRCRACLSENSEMLSLNQTRVICDKQLNISEILMTCASIQVNLDDSLPQEICKDCANTAELSYCFRIKCEESEKVLRSQEFYSCDKCTLNFSTEEELFNHFPNHTDYFNCETEDCESKFIIKPDLVELELNCTKDKTNISEIDSKKQTTSLRATRKSKRKIPIKTENYNTESIKNESDSDIYISDAESINSEPEKKDVLNNILKYTSEKNQNGVYECISCEETFENIKNLHKHTRAHKKFTCKICKKNFTILSNLRRHLRTHQDIQNEVVQDDDDNIFKCIACPKTFTKRKFLSEHLKTHTEFSCKICGVKFTFATNLRKHLRAHSRPKDEIRIWKQGPIENRTCDICYKVFKYRPSMLKHRRKHDNTSKICKFCNETFENSIKLYKHMDDLHDHEKNIICTLCGKKFFKEWNLKMHMIVHSGIKAFMCEICGISFALSGNLAAHKRLHLGIRPYKCEICGRGFTQQAALRSHEAGHSNRRDHVCPECGAAFSRAGAMRNHRKRHESHKKFPCNMCGKRFTFSSERKQHMTIHTGEKNYICDFCGKAFNRPSNLKVHRRVHTGEQPHKCELCGKSFTQAHCLRTHLNTHRTPIIEQENIEVSTQNIIAIL